MRSSNAFSEAAAEFHLVGESQGLDGKNVFPGGFLGLDNIGVFDRTRPAPVAASSRPTTPAWMAFYCSTMLAMALQLASHNPVYEDVASKFWDSTSIYIARAISHPRGGTATIGRWNEEDGFFYDVCTLPDDRHIPMKSSLYGGPAILLFAVQTLELGEILDRLPGINVGFFEWFVENRPDLTGNVACMRTDGHGGAAAAVDPGLPDNLRRILALHARRS